MSFWKHSPGPFWSDYFYSFFCSSPAHGILDKQLEKRKKYIQKPDGTVFRILGPKDAKKIESLLHDEYQTFLRSRICLSGSRIHMGLEKDGWIACGLFEAEHQKLIGCCVSRPLGSLVENRQIQGSLGLVDFFCVDRIWRKKGVASYLLQELVSLTALQKRMVHIFQKEGLPLAPLPPLWQGHYVSRRATNPSESKDFLFRLSIQKSCFIPQFEYFQWIPHTSSFIGKQNILSQDTDIYFFNYLGKHVYVAITNTFHRSVPEGFTIGEILWCIPVGTDVLPSIQRLAIEAVVDNSGYEIVLMDSSLPHSSKMAWQKDSPYAWYCFNYRPSQFRTMKPYLLP
jgi:hypothetical protein